MMMMMMMIITTTTTTKTALIIIMIIALKGAVLDFFNSRVPISKSLRQKQGNTLRQTTPHFTLK